MLEDLAAHFKMKAQDTIDRVTQLLEQGHITGVMDDRGKFIYISQVGNHIRCQLKPLLLYIYIIIKAQYEFLSLSIIF